MAADAGDASVLRTKYLDWCSARIADRFLRLPPDEIYELAHEASRDATGRVDRESLSLLSLLGISVHIPDESVPSAPKEGADGVAGSYRHLVATVTERLAERMDLPPFEEWSRAYREAPERYDAELMGFRRDAS